ncbi:FAD:protein FMN transferase [Salmonirosea aquatica]|uniref:FAD:protein FMN transferase n=1 Tax=Salmonirosea aquatica TaxID=2654236 RepID=A0A7C9BJJ6_9BACT|nr:FAD:protein FMN transferase [Cytophagaceae bacterium SJW1-29]
MARFFGFLTISTFFIAIYFPVQVYGQEKRYEFEKGLMGSPFRLVLYTSSDSLANRAAQRAFTRIEDLNEILSDYRDGSEINRLSAWSGSGEWVAVSDDLYEVLSISKKISRKTRGTFDVTVGPEVQLWRRAMRRGLFPDEGEVGKARKAVGNQYVKLRPRTKSVRLVRPNMRLDVGGIGKGFAADEAVQGIKELGIEAILIDAGGDITLAGTPPGRHGWEVEINSGKSADSTAVIPVSNVGVATSGGTYRFLEHDGVRYSHIVDPKTGIGLRHHVRTTVIAPNGTYADALATAFSVAGIRKSKRIIRRFSNVRVWLLETNGNQVSSWDTLK